MSDAKFKFPAQSYYEQSQSMVDAITSFTDDMDMNFFDVVNRHIGSLGFQDQEVVRVPTDQGKQKHSRFVRNYAKKWNHMTSEQTKNPMYTVVEVDKKYKKTFAELMTGEQQKKIDEKNEQFEREVLANIMGDGALADEMIDMMKEVTDSDWYSRVEQVTSLGNFLEEFNERFARFADKHPKKAEKLMNQLKENKKLDEFLKKTKNSNFFHKLENSVTAKRAGWVSKGMSKFGKMVDGKFIRTGVSFAKKLTRGPLGTVVNSGFNAYDNFIKDEEVSRDYKDGKNIRATAKATAGTALDTISDVGPIDGAIVGAMTGGLGGALIGGGLGALNQGAQFVFPNGYDNAKEKANQAIDWAADKGQEALDGVKEFGSEAIKKTTDTVNHVKNTFNDIQDTAKQGIEVAKKAKETWDSFKPSWPSFL